MLKKQNLYRLLAKFKNNTYLIMYFLIALSLGTLAPEDSHLTKRTWPLPFLFLPPLRRFLVILSKK